MRQSHLCKQRHILHIELSDQRCLRQLTIQIPLEACSNSREECRLVHHRSARIRERKLNNFLSLSVSLSLCLSVCVCLSPPPLPLSFSLLPSLAYPLFTCSRYALYPTQCISFPSSEYSSPRNSCDTVVGEPPANLLPRSAVALPDSNGSSRWTLSTLIDSQRHDHCRTLADGK